jgi:hypothetical protein
MKIKNSQPKASPDQALPHACRSNPSPRILRYSRPSPGETRISAKERAGGVKPRISPLPMGPINLKQE